MALGDLCLLCGLMANRHASKVFTPASALPKLLDFLVIICILLLDKPSR